jgi:hypothetical protein
VAQALTIGEREQRKHRETGRGTDPLRSIPLIQTTTKRRRRRASAVTAERKTLVRSFDHSIATNRLRTQLPGFPPLLEELEIAGWSAQRQLLAANFHDWLLLSPNRVLVTVGHVTTPQQADPVEAALVAQAVWTSVRAHAPTAADAGALLSRAAQTLWPLPTPAPRASVAVALVDTSGGQASVGLAGDCVAWRVRAATCEQLEIHQPALNGPADCTYLSHSLELSLRERLILVADDTRERESKSALAISSNLSHLDAETHRRMTAADAVALVRQYYDPPTEGASAPSASIAAIRRR